MFCSVKWLCFFCIVQNKLVNCIQPSLHSPPPFKIPPNVYTNISSVCWARTGKSKLCGFSIRIQTFKSQNYTVTSILEAALPPKEGGGGKNTKNQFYIIFLLFADKIEGDLIEKLYKAQLIPQIYESFENDEEKDHMKKYAVNLRYASNLNFN